MWYLENQRSKTYLYYILTKINLKLKWANLMYFGLGYKWIRYTIFYLPIYYLFK